MLVCSIFGLPFVDAIEAGAGTSRGPSHSFPQLLRVKLTLKARELAGFGQALISAV
jgi:hypothetical protein